MNLGPQVDREMQIRAAFLQELGKRFKPHRGQKAIHYAFHVLGCIFIFLQCGRKWGKTEEELALGVENCVLPTNEGQTTLYVAYEEEQAQKIVWNERRIQKFCNPSWIKKIYESEMLIEFHNERLFQVDGANNWKKHEGTRPSLLLLDEFKRMRPEFWDTMEPNLAVYNATTLFAGPPPEGPCQYTEIADMVKKLQAAGGKGFFTQQPSWMNDGTPGLIEWLKNRFEFYKKQGRLHIWEREYGAIYKPGGSRMIFPEYVRDRVQRSEAFLREHVIKTAMEWDWYCCADPATGDPFGVVFIAIHRTLKLVAVVDCIYETERNEKTCVKMWEKIQAKIDKWYPVYDSWQFIQDDQNAWWALEFQSQIPDSPKKAVWTPAGKQTRTKEAGIGIVNALIAKDVLWVNEGLEPFHREFSNYQTDENNKIPKGNDHLIDPTRYVMYFSHYDPMEVPEEKIPEEYIRDPWLLQAVVAQEKIDDDELLEDWTNDMFSDWARR